MAITPIEDLFTYRLHQAYNRPTGASSMNIFGVAHYVVTMLKRVVPRMRSVQDKSVSGQCTEVFTVKCSTQGGSCDCSNQHRWYPLDADGE